MLFFLWIFQLQQKVWLERQRESRQDSVTVCYLLLLAQQSTQDLYPKLVIAAPLILTMGTQDSFFQSCIREGEIMWRGHERKSKRFLYGHTVARVTALLVESEAINSSYDKLFTVGLDTLSSPPTQSSATITLVPIAQSRAASIFWTWSRKVCGSEWLCACDEAATVTLMLLVVLWGHVLIHCVGGVH